MEELWIEMMSPEEMLAHLCNKSPKQKDYLQAVYAVCKEHAESGSTDFSVATIARIGAERGVPKAQSIRNKTGENYRALISTFATSDEARKRPPRPRRSDAWADEIEDVKQRLLTQQVLAELAQAQRTIKEFIPPGMVIRVDDRKHTGAPEFKLTPFEREALEHLLSDEFLQRWRLQRGKRGDVLDGKGTPLFMPGTLQALEKALKHL
ncbi:MULTISPECIES: gamma-mobile-trio protein GmtX [unclassified Pseudomonas]|uniref:gamma-mobile-trio protein GmtX n=1 Tax=Pseudomonas TaxID=286 RepID=UPI001DE72637|nr:MULTISPECIES: gamma-mobile-trio protein GmtX [unclassified Pseudomonas]MBP2081779.1 DNA-binding HxlR family transcriptional regulator [Pseudomonas sp. PvP089]MBP2086604.1 DNA-binding HxlR family transcriptional regulator [Pseudomonas sp. PvP088]MBP2221235.1 DNA-binding HxlR family transcriptional regulator [Pseudomonas putida]MEC4878417.1 gamma-mobile-trio protein GmtX [Pseudomonas sp. NC26]